MTRRRPRSRSKARPLDAEALPTEALLALHERHFAPLDRICRERIRDAADPAGRNARWRGMDGLG